jgi:hypothetical protein
MVAGAAILYTPETALLIARALSFATLHHRLLNQ